MAGSWGHIESSGWSTIENMGDAYETVEELYFLVAAHLDTDEIVQALTAFYRFSNGDEVPIAGRSDYANAYLQTQSRMES